MLAWGANLNAQDSEGYTPLHLTIKNIENDKSQAQALTTVSRLLQFGAKIDVKDKKNKEPLDYLEDYKD